jgi:hypothetical protein
MDRGPFLLAFSERANYPFHDRGSRKDRNQDPLSARRSEAVPLRYTNISHPIAFRESDILVMFSPRLKFNPGESRGHA